MRDDLQNVNKMVIPRGKLFEKNPRFLIPFQVVYSYVNKIIEALKMDQETMHQEYGKFCRCRDGYSPSTFQESI